MINKTEMWKEIPGYEGLYSVSSLGRVRRDKDEKNTFAGRIIKPTLRGRYNAVNLYLEGERKRYNVHTLVMSVFVGDRNDKMTVNHKDGNRFNNNLENLEYISLKENIIHAYEMGLCLGRKGKDNPSAKLDDYTVRMIRKINDLGVLTQRKIADMFNVNYATISYIINRKTWRHI